MNQSHNRPALVISRVFEPIFVLPTLAFVGGVRAGLGQSELLFYAFFLLCAILLPVGLFVRWRSKTKVISWDMPDRRTRVAPLLVLSVFALLYLLGVSAFHIDALTKLFFLFAVWILGFTIITSRWKVSGHTGCMALATGLLLIWFGYPVWPILLFVLLVGWARVVGSYHTIPEVIVGALYSWLLLGLLWS
jgi:membrane-associated phospholipid phosphatase